MKNLFAILILFFVPIYMYAQDLSNTSRYSRITLDGKEAYIDIQSGSIIYPNGTEANKVQQSKDQQTVENPTNTNSKLSKVSYTVKRGDTLYSVAQRYGMNSDELASLNNMSVHKDLVIGQRLIIQPKHIPSTTTNNTATQNASQNTRYYNVRKGDTLYSIARQNGTTATQLARDNGISVHETLSIGQRLKLGTVSQPRVIAYQTTTSNNNDNIVVTEDHYRVQKGDTLYSIARNKGITVYELKAINNMTNNNLVIGQVLRIR